MEDLVGESESGALAMTTNAVRGRLQSGAGGRTTMKIKRRSIDPEEQYWGRKIHDYMREIGLPLTDYCSCGCSRPSSFVGCGGFQPDPNGGRCISCDHWAKCHPKFAA